MWQLTEAVAIAPRYSLIKAITSHCSQINAYISCFISDECNNCQQVALTVPMMDLMPNNTPLNAGDNHAASANIDMSPTYPHMIVTTLTTPMELRRMSEVRSHRCHFHKSRPWQSLATSWLFSMPLPTDLFYSLHYIISCSRYSSSHISYVYLCSNFSD